MGVTRAENTFNLKGNIYDFDIFGELLDILRQFISNSKDKKILPVISVNDVSWIDTVVIPLLLSVGQILKEYYNSPIELKLPKKDSVKQILDVSRFFSIAQNEAIYSFDMQEATSYDIQKKYNQDSYLNKHFGIDEYYELPDDEKKRIKYTVQDNYREFLIASQFGSVLKRRFSDDLKMYDDSVSCMAEVMSNATLYSMSESFVMSQILPGGDFHVCVCDTGIGIKGSLEKKNIRPYNMDMRIKSNHEIIDDFYFLFAALGASEERDRLNLWELVQMVTKTGGFVKIHTGRIQVVFDSMDGTQNSAQEWMQYMLDQYSTEKKHSSFRVYNSKLKGVHLEFVYRRESR